MDVAEKITEITKRIIEASQPDKIILFGSHARGDFNTDSDLDLLVVIPDVKHPRAESTRLRGVLRGLLIPVDIVVATPEQIERLGNVLGLVYHAALSDGEILYERAAA